jgi:ribonuclease HI
MNVAAPHYLLFSESCGTNEQGQWRFVLQSIDGTEQLEAADAEPDALGERLELLAVVRGLEALAQPSRVTLVTPSRYVNRGLAYGLQEWRTNGWQWEHYGEMVPVKNRDLWQRIDRALGFHKLECRTWRFDLPDCSTETLGRHSTPHQRATSGQRRRWLGGRIRRKLLACQQWCDDRLRSLGQWGTAAGSHRLQPLPWLQ